MATAGFFSGMLGSIGDQITENKERQHKEELAQHKMELELYQSALNSPNVNPALIPHIVQKIEEMIPGAAGTKSTRPAAGAGKQGGKKGILSGLVSGMQEAFGGQQQAPASPQPLPKDTFLTQDQQLAQRVKEEEALKGPESPAARAKIKEEQEKRTAEKDEPVGTTFITAKDPSKPWMGFNRVSKTKGGGTATLDENAVPTGIQGEWFYQAQALRQLDPKLSQEEAWNKVVERYRSTQTFGKTFTGKAEELKAIHPDWSDQQVTEEMAKQAAEDQKLKRQSLKSLLESRNLSIQTKQLILGNQVTGLTAADKREFDMKTSIDRNLIATISGKLKNFSEITDDERSALDTAIHKVESVRNEILGRKKGGGAKTLPKEIADKIPEGHKAKLSDGTTWQKQNGVVTQVGQ